MAGLSGYERETFISHSWGDPHAKVESHSRRWATQLRKTVVAHPGHARIAVDTRTPHAYTEGYVPIECIGTRAAKNAATLPPVPSLDAPNIDDGFGTSIGGPFRSLPRSEMETRWLTNDEWDHHWHIYTDEPAMVTKLLHLADLHPRHVIVLTARSYDGTQMRAEARVARTFVSIRPSQKKSLSSSEPDERTQHQPRPLGGRANRAGDALSDRRAEGMDKGERSEADA